MSGVASCLLAVLFVLPFFSQSLTDHTPPDQPGLTHSVIVNVIDSHGNSVQDLTKRNFAVSLDNKPATVITAQYRLVPHRIVVLLDASGSMDSEISSGKWRIAEGAVRELLSETDTGVPIAMLTFTDRVHEVFDFSRNRSDVLNWLLQNPDRPPRFKSRSTALFDAIVEAVKLLGDAQLGDAIYAITDGEDTGDTSKREAESVLLRSGVRLFALHFADPFRTREQDRVDAFLGMVRDSGGFAFQVVGRKRPGVHFDAEYNYDDRSRRDLKAYATELNIQVKGFWVLEVLAPKSLTKNKVELAVTDDTGKKRKDVVVTYHRVSRSADQRLPENAGESPNLLK